MQLEKPDFVELLPILADTFKTRIINKHLSVNPAYGKGYCWAEKLPSGITIIVSDTCLKECYTIYRPATDEHYFSLQFNEEAADESAQVVKGKRNHDEFQSFVKLSHTLVPEAYSFPSDKRLRSVKFLFNKSHLMTSLGKEAVEDILSQYFPVVMNAENFEPIATEYRVMLDDLWTEKIDQPLRLNYIQNRVLLLLEKYIIKLY